MTVPTHIKVAPRDGEALWAFNALYTLKLGAGDTGGDLTMFEVEFTPTGNVPLHRHDRESEAWYVLDGRVAFYVGSDTSEAGPGDLVYGPRGVPHQFSVLSDRARLLVVTAPGGFDSFLRQAGGPATERTVPEPVEMDMAAATSLAGSFGLELLGPPRS